MGGVIIELIFMYQLYYLNIHVDINSSQIHGWQVRYLTVDFRDADIWVAGEQLYGTRFVPCFVFTVMAASLP